MNGTTMTFTASELDMLRTAFEVAFDDQPDEEVAPYFSPAAVRSLSTRIQSAYAAAPFGEPQRKEQT